MAVDLENVHNLGSQSNPSPNGARSMLLDQFLDLGGDNVVDAAAVLENPELVVQLLRPVNADRDPDLVFGKVLDHRGGEQRGVRGQAEVDVLAGGAGLLAGVLDSRPDHLEIHQRLAAEE